MNPEEASDFADEEYKAALAAGFRSGEYSILFEIEGAMIQSQQVIETFQKNISIAPLKARRIAVVTGISLTRRQAERVLQAREAAVFSTVADAEAWLLSDPD